MAVAELSVSNICWPDGAEAQRRAIDVLDYFAVPAIDIAPGKAFPEMATVGPDGIDRDELVAFNRTLRPTRKHHAAVHIAGMQAVTFGRQESMFSRDKAEVKGLANHMRGVIRLAEFVGARTIVYGSGGTRILNGVAAEEADERAFEFFAALNAQATDSDITLGIELVSTTWTNGEPVFGQSGAEVVAFTRRLHEEGCKAIKFVPDSFAMADAKDPIDAVIRTASDAGVLAPHAQIAEPGMKPHTTASPIYVTHDLMSTALHDCWEETHLLGRQPKQTIAIEMMAKNRDGAPFDLDDLNPILASVIIGARATYKHALGDK